MVLEAGTELTGKAGGSWIKLDASGVHIDGHRIDLGAGGSPGNGSEAQPELPEGSGSVDAADKPAQTEDLPPAAGVAASPLASWWGMDMDEYVKMRINRDDCKAPRLQASLDESIDPASATGKRMAEMQKKVDAETTILKKAQAAETAVNRGIERAEDIVQYKKEDYWALPGETLASKHGDCEDYALLKYKLLANSGVPLNDMEILITDPPTPGGPAHAILHVREATGQKDARGQAIYKHYLLDNQRPIGNEEQIDQSQTRKYTIRRGVDNTRCYSFMKASRKK
jgi:predicted transglutaminase-like cysteine proteinase